MDEYQKQFVDSMNEAADAAKLDCREKIDGVKKRITLREINKFVDANPCIFTPLDSINDGNHDKDMTSRS